MSKYKNIKIYYNEFRKNVLNAGIMLDAVKARAEKEAQPGENVRAYHGTQRAHAVVESEGMGND